MALLIWGCPKRQTTTRIVYLPPPPVANAPAPSEPSGEIVIEEPAEPETAETPEPAPTEPATPKTAQPRRRPIRTDTPATTTPEPEELPPPPAEVPALEPHEAPGQQAVLRQQILNLQEHLRQRTSRLDGQQLSTENRKTLEDARTFLAQSDRALADGDLQRALNLARKTSQLVSALEQAH